MLPKFPVFRTNTWPIPYQILNQFSMFDYENNEEEMKEVEAKGPDGFKVTGDATAAGLAAGSGCSPATP